MRIERIGVNLVLGPFESEEQAQHVEETLRELAAEGWQNRRIPPEVTKLVRAGLQHLSAVSGHFELRVDGGPDVEPKVQYAAHGPFRKKTA